MQPTFAGSVSTPGTGLGFGLEGVAGVRIFLGKSKAAPTTWEVEDPAAVAPPEPAEEPAPGDPAPEVTPAPEQPSTER